MKRIILFLISLGAMAAVSAQDPDAASGATLSPGQVKLYHQDDSLRRLYNNDNFDNRPFTELKGELPMVGGEINSPARASLNHREMHTVMVKEVLPVK